MCYYIKGGKVASLLIGRVRKIAVPDGSGQLNSEVGDQWKLHWSQTCVFSHPEPSADPAGGTCNYLCR